MADDNSSAIIEFLGSYLEQQGIQVNYDEEANTYDQDRDLDYTKWTIKTDATISPDVLSYGIEIVTPIFHFDLGPTDESATESWKIEISKVWGTIERYFDIVTDTGHSCGTHVHVSPLDGFTADHVTQIARFLIQCRDSINNSIPGHRLNAQHTLPNFLVRPVPPLDSLGFGVSLEHVVDLMMPRNEDLGRIGFGERRFVAWNFFPLLDSRGTIEFRQPPHVTTVKEAEKWIYWAVTLCVSGLNFHI